MSMVILKCKDCRRTKKVKAIQGGVKYIYSKRNTKTCFVCDYKEQRSFIIE